jgi:hypothetical protein
MPKFLRSRKMVIATAVAGVGVLGVGVAGAVGGIPISPGPSDDAGSHPAPQATSVTVPPAASAGSGNAAAAPDAASAQDTPGVGEAPSESDLSTALDATSGTPGNAVLNDLINTAPGADRGSTIAGDAQTLASSPPVPDTAPLPAAATNHMP